jgi:hypothetical protein
VQQQNVPPNVQPIVQPVLQPQVQLVVNPVVQPAQNNVPIVQAQVVQGTNAVMDLKVQQTKLPEFWGQKDKDSISAIEFEG